MNTQEDDPPKGRLPYLVCAVGGFRPLELTREDSVGLRDAVKATPSDFFRLGYRFALNTFIDSSMQLFNSRPKQVIARLQRVSDANCESGSIGELLASDKMFIARFLAHNAHSIDCTLDHDPFDRPVEQIAEAMRLALGELKRMETRGAMPAYPSIGLATDICSLLFLEHGKPPPMTRKGLFDRVLRAALDAGAKRLENYKFRRDTMELMRSAREQPFVFHAEQFQKSILEWKQRDR